MLCWLATSSAPIRWLLSVGNGGAGELQDGFFGLRDSAAYVAFSINPSNRYFSIGKDGASEMLDVLGNIAVSGTVDGIDIATDVTANTAKVTNATHTGDVTGSSGLTIGDNKVLEKHLKVVDSPNDEEYLTYEATTGDFEWQSVPSVSGNTLDQAYDEGGA